MNINFKLTQYEIPPEALERARKKVEALAKYLGKEEAGAHVFVELGRAVGAHHSGQVWRAEINLDVPGKLYRAEATLESIESALDKALAEMSVELKKARRKERGFMRRGGAALKSILRGWR